MIITCEYQPENSGKLELFLNTDVPIKQMDGAGHKFWTWKAGDSAGKLPGPGAEPGQLPREAVPV
jgi:hypothetical protein